MSNRDVIKSRGRPATGKGAPITVRLQPDLLATVDAWIAAQPGGLSRPEAIRQIVAAHFEPKTD
ncbi:ribbon-helix-helix protein, CopG family [Sphingomonas populi]|uniref:Ribbon-helix-helix protein, CopG family n=1 Tax=Sphingomonas populi TaxID=2484750 RepID=A0A4Q6Y792_9SPHN|nr:ribbon-helix-helix domain-containing protein [Sphingomonas populi]RZF65864.1 ribbon-helix-helix protein, CopG family [Sphingomonas populi]